MQFDEFVDYDDLSKKDDEQEHEKTPGQPAQKTNEQDRGKKDGKANTDNTTLP